MKPQNIYGMCNKKIKHVKPPLATFSSFIFFIFDNIIVYQDLNDCSGYILYDSVTKCKMIVYCVPRFKQSFRLYYTIVEI